MGSGGWLRGVDRFANDVALLNAGPTSVIAARMIRQSAVVCTVLVSGPLATGCTSWGASEVYGKREEVGRRLIGAPQIAETESSSLSAGFLGTSESDGRGTNVTSGGMTGSNSSFKRTHCIQQAEVDFVQPFDVVHEEVGRAGDVTGGVLLGLLGLLVIAVAADVEDDVFEPGDTLFEEPADQTGSYVAGSAMLVGGVSWIVGSYAFLPSGPMPATTSHEKRWTETVFVEATGCGLVPADRPTDRPGTRPPPISPPDDPAADDIASRLRRLDELYKSGVINDREYKEKRKAILDSL